MMEPADGAYLVLTPDDMITGVSDEYVALTGIAHEDLIGKNLFEAFPEDPDDPESTEAIRSLRVSLEKVKRTRHPDMMPIQRYDLADGVHYWKVVNSPVFGDNGELVSIVNFAEDMTGFVASKPALSFAVFKTNPLAVFALAFVILASLFTAVPDLLDHTPVGFESRGVLHHIWHYALLLGSSAWLAGLLFGIGRIEGFGTIVTFGAVAMNTVAVFAVGDAGGLEGCLRLATLAAMGLRLHDLYRKP